VCKCVCVCVCVCVLIFYVSTREGKRYLTYADGSSYEGDFVHGVRCLFLLIGPEHTLVYLSPRERGRERERKRESMRASATEISSSATAKMSCIPYYRFLSFVFFL
jgi:hypothetical protein